MLRKMSRLLCSGRSWLGRRQRCWLPLLKAQLAGAQAEVLAATEHAKKVTDEKLTALSELQHARGELHQFKANLTWGVRYLEEQKAEHFEGLDDFRKKVESSLVVQEEKLHRLSIEYDEELYPHLMSMIAERRYLLYIILYFLFVSLLSFLIHLFAVCAGG